MKNIKNKKGFSLVELIVVITILAILGTIAFIAYGNYVKDANKGKNTFHMGELLQMVSILVNRGVDFRDTIKEDRTAINGINPNSKLRNGTKKISDAVYKVGIPDYITLKNKSNATYSNYGVTRDFLMTYAVLPDKVYYEIAGEITNEAGRNRVMVNGNYFPEGSGDTDGLISESGSDIGLKDGQLLTGSLY